MTSVSSSSPRCFRSLISAASGLIDLLGTSWQAVDDVVAGAGAVDVPAPVEELHVAHAVLDQPAGEQAVVGERRRARLGAVHLEHRASARGEMSITSGTAICMRKASSYCGDARERLGVAELCASSSLRSSRASRLGGGASRSMPAGL